MDLLLHHDLVDRLDQVLRDHLDNQQGPVRNGILRPIRHDRLEHTRHHIHPGNRVLFPGVNKIALNFIR